MRLLSRPRVVHSHVVGHKVDDEAHTVLVAAVTQASEAFVASKVGVARVIRDGKGGRACRLLRESLHTKFLMHVSDVDACERGTRQLAGCYAID